MAVRSASKNTTASSVTPINRKAGGRRMADAFLNASLVAADGKEYRIDHGIPLYADTRLGRSIINAKAAFEADPANKGKTFSVKLVASVNLVNHEESEKDIALL